MVPTDLFEYSLLAAPSSCDGDPVLAFAAAVLILPLFPEFPNGDRTAVPAGSIGDVLAVEDPDRG